MELASPAHVNQAREGTCGLRTGVPTCDRARRGGAASSDDECSPTDQRTSELRSNRYEASAMCQPSLWSSFGIVSNVLSA